MLECWRVLFDCYRKDIFGKEKRRKNKALQMVVEKLINDLRDVPFMKLDSEMSESVMVQAHRLIENHGTSKNLGSLDMLHVALVKSSSIESLINLSSG